MTERPDADVIVVGAGVMGAATAFALAAEGRSVLVLERFLVGHARGSSHGRARIFRFSYPDPYYVRMAQEALPLWHDLEHRHETQLLLTTCGLDRGAHIDDNAAALSECEASFEMIDGFLATQRFQDLRLPPDERVLFQPDSGVIAADLAVRAFVDEACAQGTDLIEDVAVDALDEDGSEVVVQSGERAWRAPVVIVTAGPWARDLLALAGIALPVRTTRETVAYFRTPGMPPTLVEWGDPTVYALQDPGRGIKVGEHIAGPVVHPDEPGGVNQDSIDRITRWVADHYTDAEPEPFDAETCMYTVTEDEHFILERYGRIVVGSPCSGHGFKFAPVIGRRLAALAAEVL